MAVQNYAKIDMTNPGNGIGTVVNIQVIDPSVDTLDSAFTWEPLTGVICSDGAPVAIGDTWNGSVFTDANNQVPTTLTLQQQGLAAIQFGINLFQQISAQVWAINEGATTPPTQSQILQLLSDSTTLQQCLQSGSLETAIIVIEELVTDFPQYSSVGTWATAQINAYLA